MVNQPMKRHRSKVYLDTSVINFIYADDAPEKMAVTKEYFEKYIKTGFYEHLISTFVLEELEKTPDESHKIRLKSIINAYDISVIEIENKGEIQNLAFGYVKAKIVPESKIFDALHVAFCTLNKIDVLLSWNFKHLSNINKERLFTIKNLELGYFFTPKLITPMEAYND